MSDDTGSLNIIVSMKDGLWGYRVGDSCSIYGAAIGFVSPEQAFASGLAKLQAVIVRGHGFDSGKGWIDPWSAGK